MCRLAEAGRPGSGCIDGPASGHAGVCLLKVACEVEGVRPGVWVYKELYRRVSGRPAAGGCEMGAPTQACAYVSLSGPVGMHTALRGSGTCGEEACGRAMHIWESWWACMRAAKGMNLRADA